MYKKEILDKWGLTAEECEKEIRAITIPGMKLTYEEKEELIFHIREFGDDPEDYETLKGHILFTRKLAKELKEDKKLVKEFVKEWRRLELKYSSLNSDLMEKSLDELTDMWMSNYFELYFMEDHFDCIKEDGGKRYAQYYCYNVGICPESEVSMWA